MQAYTDLNGRLSGLSMKIILVRHGETQDAVAKLHTRRNSPLSPLGLHQAQKVAERLRHEHIDHIYSSDFPRVLQTLEPIRAFHPGIPVTLDERVREVDLGVVEGQPKGVHARLAHEAQEDFFAYAPENGEAVQAVRERFIPFLEELAKKHTGTVLVVCHAYPIMYALLHMLGGSEAGLQQDISNTSVTIIELPEKKVHLLACTKHLN
jgi:broad specificity phosphatase PhoE